MLASSLIWLFLAFLVTAVRLNKRMLAPLNACKKQLGANTLLCVLRAVQNYSRRDDSKVTSRKGGKKRVAFNKSLVGCLFFFFFSYLFVQVPAAAHHFCSPCWLLLRGACCCTEICLWSAQLPLLCLQTAPPLSQQLALFQSYLCLSPLRGAAAHVNSWQPSDMSRY